MYEHLALWLGIQLAGRKWGAKELAERLSIPPPIIEKWLSGEARPERRRVPELAAIFNTCEDYVLAVAGYIHHINNCPEFHRLTCCLAVLSEEQRRACLACLLQFKRRAIAERERESYDTYLAKRS